MVFECLAQMDGIYVSQSVDVMLVCKHWTAVALNTSALWQTIPERARVGWFAIAFARSKNRPVDIVTNPTSLLSVAPLLVKEAHRLRTLDVLPRDTDVDGTDSDVASLLEDTIFAVARFPRLETLIMENPSVVFYKLASFNDPERFPALQILHVDTLYIPWDSSVFRQLRILEIYNVHVPEPDAVPLSVFLDVLKTCQCLEELRFHYVPFIDFTGHGQPAADCVVSLPMLRSFYWFWPYTWAYQSPTDVYRLLEHLYLPTTVDVYLRFEVEFEGREPTHWLDEYFNINYLKMIPYDAGRLPILTAVKTARFCSPGPWKGGEWANLYCERCDFEGSFEISFDRARERGFPYNRMEQFYHFMSLFNDSFLSSLTANLYGLDLYCLRDAFNNFPWLETLELFHEAPEAPEDECWPRLKTRSFFVELTAPMYHDDGDVTANLLRLRNLSLENFPWSEHAFCLLFASLVVRAKEGAPLLSSLRVKVGEEGYHGGERIPDRDAIAALQAIVEGPVEYVDTTVYTQSAEVSMSTLSAPHHRH